MGCFSTAPRAFNEMIDRPVRQIRGADGIHASGSCAEVSAVPRPPPRSRHARAARWAAEFLVGAPAGPCASRALRRPAYAVAAPRGCFQRLATTWARPAGAAFPPRLPFSPRQPRSTCPDCWPNGPRGTPERSGLRRRPHSGAHMRPGTAANTQRTPIAFLFCRNFVPQIQSPASIPNSARKLVMRRRARRFVGVQGLVRYAPH